MKVTLLKNFEDWEAMYVDGKRVESGHEIRLKDALKALGIECEVREVSPDDGMDAFPESLPA